jgi:SAM-dependent methyltransferase
MLHSGTDKQWERFGREDPYYGVLSHERFRKEQIAEDSLKEFFKSGQHHINTMLTIIRSSIDPAFVPTTALDFGCGVGRCSIALARVCQAVVGVDVSESMLEEARRNCSRHSISNLTLIKSDDALSNLLGPFELVHSVLVFQHIPEKRGKAIFTRLVTLLSENGVGVIQFVFHRAEPAVIRMLGNLRKRLPFLHNFVNLLYGKPFLDALMEKNAYDLNQLLLILHEHGCGNMHLRFFGTGKLLSVVLFFQKNHPTLCDDAFDAY